MPPGFPYRQPSPQILEWCRPSAGLGTFPPKPHTGGTPRHWTGRDGGREWDLNSGPARRLENCASFWGNDFPAIDGKGDCHLLSPSSDFNQKAFLIPGGQIRVKHRSSNGSGYCFLPSLARFLASSEMGGGIGSPESLFTALKRSGQTSKHVPQPLHFTWSMT